VHTSINDMAISVCHSCFFEVCQFLSTVPLNLICQNKLPVMSVGSACVRTLSIESGASSIAAC